MSRIRGLCSLSTCRGRLHDNEHVIPRHSLTAIGRTTILKLKNTRMVSSCVYTSGAKTDSTEHVAVAQPLGCSS